MFNNLYGVSSCVWEQMDTGRHVYERPWHIFVTQRPLIFAFDSQPSDDFRQKNGFFKNFDKFDEMLRNFGYFGPESPYFWMHFTERPLFLCTLSLKDPLFWHNLSPKDPYIWGAWWHSYITFICECPPPPRYKRWLAQNYFQICIFMLIKWGTKYPFEWLERIYSNDIFSNKWWIKSVNTYSLL